MDEALKEAKEVRAPKVFSMDSKYVIERKRTVDLRSQRRSSKRGTLNTNLFQLATSAKASGLFINLCMYTHTHTDTDREANLSSLS